MSSGSGIDNVLPIPRRSTHSVRVDNVNKNNASEVVSLFSALVGQIRSFQEIKDAIGTHLEITFLTREAASKALCMTGYNCGGVFLAVTPITITPPPSRVRSTSDDRRNLYVLGLPFALTKNEFAAVFSRYGTVAHCVILATVDNSSRRRGFIVMSTHEEAKFAMSELTRTQIKGHTIDVSWAVVQRSQGFLDGGDRAMLLDSRGVQVPPRSDTHSRPPSETSEPTFDPVDSGLGSYISSPEPTNTLLVAKLPALLFSQMHDFEPLFYPFGNIKKLQVVGSGLNGTLSVLVQYLSTLSAKDARDAIHGQNYANSQVDVEFVRLATNSLDLVQGSRANTPLDMSNTFKPPSQTISGSTDFYRLFKGTEVPANASEMTFMHERPTHATPPTASFAHHERNNSRSSRWSSDNTRAPLAADQLSRADMFLSSNHYQNLLA